MGPLNQPNRLFFILIPISFFLLNVARQFSASSRSQSANTKHTHGVGRIKRGGGHSSRSVRAARRRRSCTIPVVIKHNKARATGKKNVRHSFLIRLFSQREMLRAPVMMTRNKTRGDQNARTPDIRLLKLHWFILPVF